MRVIKDNQVIDDNWQRIEITDEQTSMPAGDIIVPFSYWIEHKSELLERKDGRIAICIHGDDAIEEVVNELQYFQLIALDFPAFKDGRNYSHARLLRDRYGYRGELRAVGDVLRDQLFFLHRCGFDSFQVREDKDIEDALKGLSDFSVTYQTASDGAVPVYKNRLKTG